MTTPQETLERVLSLSHAESCVAIAEELSSANLRWANNTLTTNGVKRTRRLTVVATVNGVNGMAAGTASSNQICAETLEGVVRAAEAAARSRAAADDAQPLPAGSGVSTGWSIPPAETSFHIFSRFAADLGAAFARARRNQQLLFGYAQHSSRSTYLASSTGLRLRHEQPSGYVEINAKLSDHSASVWVGAASADFTDVDLTALDCQLTERLGWAQRRLQLPPGRHETLLPPGAVADLMLPMYLSAGARDALDGRTVFSKAGGGTRVGERIAALPITLRSDPAAPGLQCAPFVVAHSSGATSSVFDNGLSLEPASWITEGRLSALLQTRHSAKLTGLAVTPRIDNLIMEGPPGGRTLSEMVADTRRGLLLTCLWYIREVDPRTLLLTGLTRDGVFLVEGGEVVGCVNNFRFNESPVDLLRRITEIGTTDRALAREWGGSFPRTAMPPVRIDDFNMSTVSEAS